MDKYLHYCDKLQTHPLFNYYELAMYQDVKTRHIKFMFWTDTDRKYSSPTKLTPAQGKYASRIIEIKRNGWVVYSHQDRLIETILESKKFRTFESFVEWFFREYDEKTYAPAPKPKAAETPTEGGVDLQAIEEIRLKIKEITERLFPRGCECESCSIGTTFSSEYISNMGKKMWWSDSE